MYAEIPPPEDLSLWIDAVWHMRRGPTSPEERRHRILPDGCVDLLFNRDGGPHDGFLVGPMTRAQVAVLAGDADFFGIRFRPGVFRSLAACSALDLQDIEISLSDAGVHLAAASIDALFQSTCLRERARLILPAVARHLTARAAPDPTVGAAIEEWRNAASADRALPSVSAVAAHAGIAVRSLERRFAAWVGYPPAHYRRLVRFRRALAVSDRGRQPWAVTAFRCGYADQAHLSRDFREFAGTTASAWADECRAVGFVQDTPSAAA